LTELYFCFNKH